MSDAHARPIGRVGALLCVLAGVVALGVSHHVNQAGRWDGVAVHDVAIPVADWSARGRVYEADEPVSGKRAAVLLLHGYAANLETLELAIALDLARAGFFVLAVDFNGHGHSGGGIRSVVRGTGEPGDQRFLRSVLDWLKGWSEIDLQRVAIVGHSDGASAAFGAVALDGSVAAVVYVAGPEDIKLYRSNVRKPVDPARRPRSCHPHATAASGGKRAVGMEFGRGPEDDQR